MDSYSTVQYKGLHLLEEVVLQDVQHALELAEDQRSMLRYCRTACTVLLTTTTAPEATVNQ